MRKKYLLATSLLVIASLSSCKSQVLNNENTKLGYEAVKQYMIPYSDIFSFSEKYYFIYIYSLHCLHCELLKKDVIDYGLHGKIKMRFIQYYDEIPIIDDTSATIGMKNIDDLGILGTPALLLIESQSVSINVSGRDMIKNVIDTYN